MVDEGRVTRLLRGVADRTNRLDVARTEDPSVRGSMWLDGIKYLFVTTIEGCIDVAQHICASDSLGAPDTNAAALRLLGQHGIVPGDLADALARAAGFRNVLVHQYIDVDDSIVTEALEQLDDFRAFVSSVSAWLLAQQ